MKAYEIHPAADLFPMMPDEQLKILADDIKKQGLIYPIILLDGQILDGRNRLKACGMAGIKPTFSEYTNSRTPTEYVLAVNCKRRDLTLSQRAMIAASALPMLEAEARQRMAAGGGDKKSGVEIIPPLIENAGKARDKAAELMDVNPRYVSDAKRLQAEAPEVAAEVAAGTKTLPEAKREVFEKPLSFCPTCQAAYKLSDGHTCEPESTLTSVNFNSDKDVFITSLDEVKGQKFSCIYADPPWSYQNQGTRGSTDNHYQTMTVDQIAAMPIGELAADNSHLHLWTTNAFLFECPKIFAAWGFEFKSSFVWVKPQMGMGNYWRNSHEILLLGVKGNLTARAKNLMSWSQIKRGKHSEKPQEIRSMIERLSPGPYLELFGRKYAKGWTVFGNEILESQTEMVTA